MRIELIIKYIGLSLLLEALFMFLSAAVSAYNGYDGGFLPLVLSGTMAGILGAYPRIFVRKSGKLSSREGCYIVVGSWFFCCLFGALPYMMYEMTFSDAWFESVSGFTTTGASVLNDIEAIPQGLLFWRMSTAWIGGIGIVALFSLAVPSAKGNGNVLSGAELSDLARTSTSMKQHSFVCMMIATYVVLTVLSIAALKLSGMRWFDAATHAMSACSTCGFSTKNASIAAFDSPLVETVLTVTMIVASLRFVLLSGVFFKGGLRRLAQSEVTRTFLGMVLAGMAAMTVGLYHGGEYESLASCFRAASFQVASIFTTTGFATADTNLWPAACKSLIIAGSFVCGCSGSTSGGMKADRLVVICKSIWNKLVFLHSPNAVVTLKVDKNSMSDKMVASVSVFVICYLLIVCLGALVYSLTGLDMQTAWSASIACMGNVGPGFGMVGSMQNYAGMPELAKWSSTFLMLVGRLEIFPLLYVFVASMAK